ncbi:M66 family metalloprotease [Blastococcus sp. VKM Ac-2987]|uniref:M66 family metalloprotease n=1 Tax=Blastococcus sp. VKM Ac-2987 TaxID=3004141 RepID=UPI0022AB5D47|nr:M66 family metalloprotease [Blastococcus sp. VKM Ac-2987]MCZ2859529.1 M66 family metalloprotease [Blastococcus sp. VKM Ac-2987]
MRATPGGWSLRPAVVVTVAAVLLGMVTVPSVRAEDRPATAGDVVVGELVQAWADPEPAEHQAEHEAGHADVGLLSWIDVADGESVRVPTDDVADIELGATVEVTVGGEIRDEATVEQGLEPAREVVSAEVVAPPEPAVTTVPHTNGVTVVMVQPGGAPRDGRLLADVVAAVDGPARQFWNEQSDGGVTVAVTGSHDWITTTAGCAAPFQLWNEAAAAVGWTSGPGKHLLLYVPSGTPDCGYGLGTVGSGIGAGGLVYVQAIATSVLAHELGHNFGLGHSSAVQCDASPESAPCRTVAYEDLYDVMGISWHQVGSLNAPHAARLGLLPSSAQRSVSSTGTGGTFTLAPMGGRSGLRVLSLTTGTTRYWVEYRTATGRDTWLSDPRANYGLQPGVLVRRDGPGPNSDTSLLLDGTPAAQANWDGDVATVLPAGSRMFLGEGLTVGVTSTSSTDATVTVRTAADGPSADSPIAVRYASLGGETGRLGAPLSTERCGLRDGGCQQTFAQGSIYWSAATGARVVQGDIGARWGALGQERGWLGYPKTDVLCGLKDGGCYQVFQGGGLYGSAATGVRAVSGFLWGRWASLGYEAGWLGYPASDVLCGLKDGGCYQRYQGGALYWSSATGAQAVSGFLWGRWASLGYEAGWLGYPAGDVRCGLRDGGCYQLYQRGALYWSPATGARAVSGFLWDRWAAMGYESGRLGYPMTDVTCGLRNGGCYQIYQGGGVYWSGATGAWIVQGELWGRWAAQGYEAGALGYPLSDVMCVPGRSGCYQRFQGGTIHTG